MSVLNCKLDFLYVSRFYLDLVTTGKLWNFWWEHWSAYSVLVQWFLGIITVNHVDDDNIIWIIISGLVTEMIWMVNPLVFLPAKVYDRCRFGANLCWFELGPGLLHGIDCWNLELGNDEKNLVGGLKGSDCCMRMIILVLITLHIR